MDWNAGQFTIKVAHPESGEPVERAVAGWISPLWALDFRVFNDGDGFEDHYRGGWTLTHLGTGHSAFQFLLPLDEAKQAAEFVNSLWDWNFTNPAEVANIRGVYPEVIRVYGSDVFRGKAAFSPTFFRGQFDA